MDTRNPRYKELLATLPLLPSDWELTPIGMDKQPYSKGFLDNSIPRSVIASHIEHGFYVPGGDPRYAWGFSLKTGNGLIAIDVDGAGAYGAFCKASAKYQQDPVKTVSWTSGKPHRLQLLYQVQSAYIPLFEGFIRLPLRKLDGIEFDEDLDIRYDRCVSVLPPSHHPQTPGYRWINSPYITSVAPLPLWLCDFVRESLLKGVTTPSAPPPKLTTNISPVPLTFFITKVHYELLQRGVVGNRNDTAFKLGCDLVGAENFLNSHGQSFTGSAETLFYNFCAKCPCDSDWDSVKWMSVWKSVTAKTRNPATPISTLAERLKRWKPRR